MITDHLNKDGTAHCSACSKEVKPPSHGVTPGYYLSRRGWVERNLPGLTYPFAVLLLCTDCEAEYHPYFEFAEEALRHPDNPAYKEPNRILAKMRAPLDRSYKLRLEIAKEVQTAPLDVLQRVKEMLDEAEERNKQRRGKTNRQKALALLKQCAPHLAK